MSNADTSGIHRLLDDAFAGITTTPELQDLKEELRGSLTARAAELQENGMDAGESARRAITELGDIDALIASFGGPDAVEGSRLASPESIAELVQRNRVKPKPAFVVRTVILSFVLATGIAVLVFGALGVIPWGIPVLLILSVTDIALPVGIIVTDALRQETSQHYASPASRAIGFGLAGAAMAYGLAVAALFLVDMTQLPLLVAAIALVVVAIVGFTWLGVTQTNRTKPWALAMQRRYETEDPFASDPGAAARFGMYTVVIWVLAIAGFVVLSATIGFAWSWLAIVAGLVVFMLTLARMVFPVKH